MKLAWTAAAALLLVTSAPNAFASRFHVMHHMRHGMHRAHVHMHNGAHYMRVKMHHGHMHMHNMLYHGHM